MMTSVVELHVAWRYVLHLPKAELDLQCEKESRSADYILQPKVLLVWDLTPKEL
jgi:hypothetical protein